MRQRTKHTHAAGIVVSLIASACAPESEAGTLGDEQPELGVTTAALTGPIKVYLMGNSQTEWGDYNIPQALDSFSAQMGI